MVLDAVGPIVVLLANQFPVQAFVVLWLLCLGGAAVGWLVIYPYSQRQGPLRRFAAEMSPGPFRWQSLAGLRYPLANLGTMTATPPLARVICEEAGIRVQPAVRLLRFLIPSLMFEWQDVAIAEAVGSSSVRLRFRSVDAPILLRSLTDRSSFLDELDAHQVKVDRQAQQSSWWSTR